MRPDETIHPLRRMALTIEPEFGSESEDLALARHLLTGAAEAAPERALPEPAAVQAARALAEAFAEARLTEPEAIPEAPEALEAPAGFDVAVRTVPFRTSTNPLSVAPHVAGRRVARTLGPFLDAAGRPIWIDLFRRVRQVSVVRAPGTAPFLLLSIRGLLHPGTDYPIEAGSVWILAKLLAPAAPDGAYCGIRVKGGRLRLSAPTVVVGGTLQIGGAVTATLEIETDPPAAPAGGGVLGLDGDATKSDPPAHAQFVFGTSGARLDQADEAGITAYGSAGKLAHRVAPGEFEPLVNRVMLPFDASPAAFHVRRVRSELFEPLGSAGIVDGAWALAVTITSPDALGEAAGAGAVALRLAAGLSARWRGLLGGPVRLGETIVMAEPGRLVLAAARKFGVQAIQRLLLWQEAGNPARRSQVTLAYADPEPLRFFSESGVADALQLGAELEASLDRPVAVDGRRFPLRAASALALFTHDGAGFRVLVAADATPGAATGPWRWPVSLALTNALIQLAAPVGLLVSGALDDPEQVRAGVAAVLIGVRGIVPILRDPYVTNLPPLPRRDVTGIAVLPGAAGFAEAGTATRLFAVVRWPDPAHPDLRMALLLGGSAGAASMPAAETPAADDAAEGTGSAALVRFAADAAIRAREEDREAEQRLRQIFERSAGLTREALLLLDVSSNIDQFGVGFGLSLREPSGTAGAPPPLRIQGLDLSAPMRNLRVILLPQFQWEPVTNLPNPLVGPFPGRLASADDGGRTALGTPSVTLVPIAPERLAKQILDEFNDGPNGMPVGAQFTLPFGMKAAARFQPDTGFDTHWATLGFNQPTTSDGRLTGGLQIAAEAHPARGPEAESPSFPGAAWQTRNGIDPATHLPFGMSVLSASFGNPGVEKFFNDEMGPGGSRPRVPVTRVDLSGYGASAFSAWANPNAVAATSQVRFDVFVGRTAYEVVQVASILYPWAVPVVRTITLERRKEGAVIRFDSGWVATGPGLYRYPPPDPAVATPPGWTAIETHPGVVHGAWNVRRIRETDRVVSRTFPPEFGRPAIAVELLEVRFDADFEIQDVVAGQGSSRLVPSRDQVGYVQRQPQGYPLLPEHLAAILSAEGAAGGPVDCVIDVARSGQALHVARVDVAPAPQPLGGPPQFAAAARGALALPRDGEWSAVRHDLSAAEPQPVDIHTGVPLLRVGTASGSVPSSPWYRVAEPGDLLREDTPAVQFGLLQGSEGHRTLFPRPRIHEGQTEWSSTEHPVLADTYTLSLGVGLFPPQAHCLVGDALWGLDIGDDGRFTLLPTPTMRFTAPPGVADRHIVDTAVFKIRTRYQKDLRYTLDPTLPKSWSVDTDSDFLFTSMDLGPFPELLGIRHGFAAAMDEAVRFVQPTMVFPPPLQPVVEVLEFLATLLGIDQVLDISAHQGSFKFKAALVLPIENPRSPDHYIDFGGIEIKGKLQLGVASAPEWNGFLKIELGSRVPVIPPIFGGGEIGVELEGNALSEQKVTVQVKWSASVGKRLGPIEVKGSFFFGIQVVVSTTGSWQIGLLVGISGSADIWIAKITVKLELLAAIKVLSPAESPPSGSKQAIGRAKVAAEISIAVFVTISVEYTVEVTQTVHF